MTYLHHNSVSYLHFHTTRNLLMLPFGSFSTFLISSFIEVKLERRLKEVIKKKIMIASAIAANNLLEKYTQNLKGHMLKN